MKHIQRETKVCPEDAIVVHFSLECFRFKVADKHECKRLGLKWFNFEQVVTYRSDGHDLGGVEQDVEDLQAKDSVHRTSEYLEEGCVMPQMTCRVVAWPNYTPNVVIIQLSEHKLTSLNDIRLYVTISPVSIVPK